MRRSFRCWSSEVRMIDFVDAAVAAVFGAFASAGIWQYFARSRREAFIRQYKWPPGLLDKLAAHHPGFTRKETALVGSGLRQFFLAYLMGGRRYVAMPSQVADDLWHEFILYTRDYDDFCRKSFGRFLHHTPAVRLASQQRSSNEGLRRTWHHACKLENISPLSPTRLPLLFALDAKFNIPNGYRYTPDCSELRRGGESGTQCSGDFSSTEFDGGTDGLGDSGGDGGDGGGCGGD
jgi:hypothetical protein